MPVENSCVPVPQRCAPGEQIPRDVSFFLSDRGEEALCSPFQRGSAFLQDASSHMGFGGSHRQTSRCHPPCRSSIAYAKPGDTSSERASECRMGSSRAHRMARVAISHGIPAAKIDSVNGTIERVACASL